MYDRQELTTRFNPTVSGPDLHLGHLYLVLVNVAEAQAVGGTFIVRFDDDQPVHDRDHGRENIERWTDIYKETLSIYVTPDYWVSEREQRIYLSSMPRPLKNVEQRPHDHFSYPLVPGTTRTDQFPCVPRYTAVRVYMDWLIGVNRLIRGRDLINEFALYQYFRDLAGYPRINHVYLPRLAADPPGMKGLSKTRGKYFIRDLTAKHGKDGVLQILRNSCLIDPEGDFKVANIKASPHLEICEPKT